MANGINILPGTPENLELMKGQKFVPQKGEGFVYLKLVMIKPDTMENGDPAQSVEDAEGVILCGRLDKIQGQIRTWFNEAAIDYRKSSGEIDPATGAQRGRY